MPQRRFTQVRGQRGGDAKLDAGGLQVVQIAERARLGLHRGGVGDTGHVIPLLHKLLGGIFQAESRDGVFGDLAKLHGGDRGRVVGRNRDATLVEEVDVDLVPDSHGV